jgi:hydrogenase maturation factor
MKKTIFAIAALAIFSVTGSFAQAYKSNGHDGPVYVTSSRTNNPVVNVYDIDHLDNIVNLTRKQENEITKIENYYNRVVQSSKKSQTLESLTRLQEQKRHDILEVLTSAQRQKLNEYQYAQKNNNRNKFDSRAKYNRRG